VADRRVTATGKDRDGVITKLCGPWGKVSKAQAIDHIENGDHTYYVQNGTRRTEILVITGVINRYLRTDADRSSADNLDNLPDC
jgi:Protein of unknown function (DUF3892)